MAIGVIFEGAGVTQAQYDAVRTAVAPDNQPRSGLLYHAAGPTPTGWCVVEIWESQAALDRFFQERLGQELQKRKMNMQPRSFQVHNTMQA